MVVVLNEIPDSHQLGFVKLHHAPHSSCAQARADLTLRSVNSVIGARAGGFCELAKPYFGLTGPVQPVSVLRGSVRAGRARQCADLLVRIELLERGWLHVEAALLEAGLLRDSSSGRAACLQNFASAFGRRFL